MYMYVGFFNEESIKRERYFISGSLVEPVKNTFENYYELNSTKIKGCIGYFKKKEYYNINCVALEISNMKADKQNLSFDFKVLKELNISSGDINKSLYRFAYKNDWIDKATGYYPIVCIVNKSEFDKIIKVNININKISSKTAKLEQLRREYNWKGICDIYEPLERCNHNDELWNNVNELYYLAFACSKMGEPKNGQEKDKKHLSTVRRYRELSINFFKRCYELEPYDFRYASSLGYRYYLNVMELTKPKGRRDGKVNEEINNALLWLNKALQINPRSIKDNYRKGKLILDKQINNFKYSTHRWTKVIYEELENMESEGIKSLETLIEIFESIEDEKVKKRYSKEYTRGLYCLGCFYLQKPNLRLNEYILKKIAGNESKIIYSNNTLQYIAKSKGLLEKCFYSETDISLESDFTHTDLVKYEGKWNISPLDKFYRLGLVYLDMYFVKKMFNTDKKRIDYYGKKAYMYLNISNNIGRELIKRKLGRRDIWFISEKLAWYYIISEQYEKGFKIIENAKASYILNTYSIALLLSKNEENIKKAERALLKASKDNFNKAKNISIALLAYTYLIQEKNDELQNLLEMNKGLANGANKKLLRYLRIED